MKPRSANDLLPKCPDCGLPEEWDRVPSGWVRECGHGGVVANPMTLVAIAKQFKATLPVAERTNWLYRSGSGAAQTYLIDGRLWRLMQDELTDVWAVPPDGTIYAKLQERTRTFAAIGEPLPKVEAKPCEVSP